MNIERERFEAWLFSQPLSRMIDAANSSHCFLCSFLKETSTAKPSMTWTDWDNRTDSKKYPIPSWALRLISREWVMEKDKGFISPVTVKEMQARYLELFPDTHLEPSQPHPTSMSELRKVR